MKIQAVSVAALAALVIAGLTATTAEAATPKVYKNCTELNKKYPHGVGKTGAKDLISGKYVPGKSVTTFKVSTTIYKANIKRDGDRDGIACEKK